MNQERDQHVEALKIGRSLDLAETCAQALKVTTSLLGAPLVTLEILEPESRAILGPWLQRRSEGEPSGGESGRTAVCEPIGAFGKLHLTLEDVPEQRRLLTLLVRRIELAWRSCLQQYDLERSRSALERRRDLDRRIGRELAQVNGTSHLTEVIQRLLDSIVPTEFVAVYFLSPADRSLELSTAKGFENWEIEDAVRTAWNRHPGEVMRSGRTIDVPDTMLDEAQQTLTSKRRHEIRSRLFTAIHCGEEIVGTIGLASSKPNYFDEGHRDIIRFLADLAGLAWGRIRESRRVRLRESMLRTNARISSVLLASTHFEAVAEEILELLADSLEADSACVVSLDEGTGLPGVIATWPSGSPPEAALELVARHQAELREGRDVVSPIGFRYRDGATRLGPEQLPVLVAVPMVSSGTTTGAIVVRILEHSVQWNEVTIEAIRQVANGIIATSARNRLEGGLRNRQRLEAVGELAAGIAHEFNNLLWPIHSYSRMARERIRDPEVRVMLEEIEKASTRAGEQVDRVLDHCRNRRQELRKVNLDQTIEDALRFLRHSIPSGVTLEESIEWVGMARVEVGGLHQVLIQLCRNACQAMPNGGTLTVRLAPASDRLAVLEIGDDGCGMDERLRERMFEEYFTTRRSEGSIGLGLPMVADRVREMQGTLEIESTPGRGTTIRIGMPVEPGNGGDEAAEERSRVSGAPAPGTLVHLVDDEEQIRAMCEDLLKILGYEVRTFARPEELIRDFRAEGRRPDAIITDLSMPEMSGIELARTIRSMDEAIPIICCTGYGAEETEQEAKAAGITTFARKPLDLDEFDHILRTELTAGVTG